MVSDEMVGEIQQYKCLKLTRLHTKKTPYWGSKSKTESRMVPENTIVVPVMDANVGNL
jgi:hypothetical protein